jgi:hypothetical protein
MSPLAAARRRHPSTQPPVPVGRVVSGVARALDRSGVRWPRVAAAALQVRGRSGLSPDELARRLGVHADVVRSAEAGECDVDQLPEPLRGQVRAVLLEAAPRWR